MFETLVVRTTRIVVRLQKHAKRREAARSLANLRIRVIVQEITAFAAIWSACSARFPKLDVEGSNPFARYSWLDKNLQTHAPLRDFQLSWLEVMTRELAG